METEIDVAFRTNEIEKIPKSETEKL